MVEALEASCLGRRCRCWCSCAIVPNSYSDWALRTGYIALLITPLQSWKECHNNTFLKRLRGILTISIIAISVWQTVKTHSHSFCTQCYRASGMVQSLYLWTRDQRPKVQTDKHAQRQNQRKKEKGKKKEPFSPSDDRTKMHQQCGISLKPSKPLAVLNIFTSQRESLIHLWHKTFWGLEAVLRQIQFTTMGNSFLSGVLRYRWTRRHASSSHGGEWGFRKMLFVVAVIKKTSNLALMWNHGSVSLTHSDTPGGLRFSRRYADIIWALCHRVHKCAAACAPRY